MLDVYRRTANRVGSNEAIALAHELSAWHDEMVKHRRRVTRLGFDADRAMDEDDAPARAAELWRRAVEVFGDAADELEFLRRSAEQAAQAARAGKAVVS